jgi:hypothetical protein
VGQVGNLRPIGNRPVNYSEFNARRIANPPQVTNLPHVPTLHFSTIAARNNPSAESVHQVTSFR